MQKLNILTRTSNRPLGFDKCFYSVKNQTYKNINHIVSYDTEKDLSYLNNYKIKKIKVHKNEKILPPLNNDKKFWFTPYNLYCNTLLDTVDDGWILFLDDDDFLDNNKVIEQLMDKIKDENTLYIIKMKNSNNETIPRNFNNKKIQRGNIGTSCVVFNSKFKNVKWDSYKCADFRFIEKLKNIIPNIEWLNIQVVTLNNNGNLGKREDIN